jgi:hypothetical protein
MLRHPSRLSGAPVGALGRSSTSLVSAQLSRLGTDLVPRGISQPYWVQSTLTAIRQLPTTLSQARAQVGQIATAVSAALLRLAAAGGAAGTTSVTTSAVSRFFGSALNVLTRIGSALTTPIIVPRFIFNPLGGTPESS